MSTCISREGEFSEHTLDATGEHRFTCRLCWVTDEDAMRAALDAAESRLASVKALADDPDVIEAVAKAHYAAWSLNTAYAEGWDDLTAHNLGMARATVAAFLAAVLGSDAHTEQKGTGE